jgi:hypothetical protein
MLLEQVRAAAAVLFFLGAIITVLWGTEIAAAAAGAWARGSAQAAAERRRFAEARAANNGGRGLSGAWQQAKGTARAMRGAARDAHAWARREHGPVRRVAAAAATGAYIGAKGAGRAAAAARRRAAAARAAGGANGFWRTLGSWHKRGSGPGTSSQDTNKSSRWRPSPVGVCDQCGVTVGRRSLQTVLGLGGRLHQLCLRCRTSRPSHAEATSTSGRNPFAGRVIDLGDEWPQLTAGPTPVPSVTVDMERLMAGARRREPLPAPASTAHQVTAPAGTATAITGGTNDMTQAIGSGRPGSAVAVRPSNTPVLTGRVAARPGSAVAVRGAAVAVQGGDRITHGEQDEIAQAVAAALDRVAMFQRAMEDNLTSAECPADMIEDVAAWSQRWTDLASRIRGWQASDNGRLDQYVDIVEAIGGPSKSASPGYLSELR